MSFKDGAIPPSLKKAYDKGGYVEVALDEDEAPHAVNIVVGGKQSPLGSAPGTAPGSVLWHGVELDDLGDRITSLTNDGTQVISLLVSSNAEVVVLKGTVAAQRDLPEEMKVECFQYRLAFALTDFVADGRHERRTVATWPLPR